MANFFQLIVTSKFLKPRNEIHMAQNYVFNRSLTILAPVLILSIALMTSCNQNSTSVTDPALVDARAGKPQAPIAYQIAETNTTALASGRKAWVTGRKAWVTGRKAWVTGDVATLEDNLAIWTQIRLQQAQTLAPNWGAGVKVAVIDTGIDLNHPAFVGHLAPSGDWKDFVDADNTPQEVAGGEAYGHGTSVASIVLQVAPKALIMPIRVLESSGMGDTSKIASAIGWAAQHGARVINLSLGTDAANFDCAVQKEIALAIQNYDTLMVFAAGNTGDTKINYPAITVKSNPNNDPAVKACRPAPYNLIPSLNANVNVASISVGSVDNLDQKSGFSSYGTKLEMLAPGENIYGPYPENAAAAWSGTSMSAPLVSGSLALAVGQNLRSGVKVMDLPDILIGKTDSVDTLNSSFAGQIGKGRLNIEMFLKSVL
jgi:thermitase